MEKNHATQEVSVVKRKKKKTAPIILSVVVLIGAIYAIKTYMYNQHHETTEDAQIEGNISPVLPRISGYVNEIRFEDNTFVHKGDTLIVLDDRDLHIKVLQAQAALENARANVEVVKANNGSATAAVSTAKSNIDLANVKVLKTKEDFDRADALLKQHATTQSQFDNVKAERDAALTQLDVAKKQMDALQKQNSAVIEQIKVAESVVAQRQADLDFANLQRSYAFVIAPLDGIVSKKSVQPGQFVQAGQALFSIVDENKIWIIANFKETQMEKMMPGQTVNIHIDAFGDISVEGEVESFSGATGARFALLPPDNATGNFVKVVQRIPVKIKLKVDKELAAKLRPGMSVAVVVNTDEKK
ncbi:MAG: HlyD family secretion protein [Bacteroidetes bacterium]|nr:HlyD family secretion protein [Bacteroidota bacterium]